MEIPACTAPETGSGEGSGSGEGPGVGAGEGPGVGVGEGPGEGAASHCIKVFLDVPFS